MKQVFFAVLSATAILLAAQGAKAQTNLQVFYDLGSDRQCVTTTLEGFYNDNWGNTFFFVDHDYPVSKDQNDHINGTYWEIARCFNFWQDSPLNFLSLQLEYNGGAYRGYDIKHALPVWTSSSTLRISATPSTSSSSTSTSPTARKTFHFSLPSSGECRIFLV